MIDKIKNRLAGEQGFTLIELLVVIVILGILIAIAVPSYLSFRSKAEQASAQANVRSAIPGAEAYYQDTDTTTGGNGSYTNISYLKLKGQTPGIAPSVKAGANAAGNGYCIEDTVNGSSYNYTGGTGGAATISTGVCAAATYPAVG